MKKILFLMPLVVLLYSCHVEVSPPPTYISERNNSLEEIKTFCDGTEGKCVFTDNYIIFIDEGYLFLFSKIDEQKAYLQKSNIKKILKYKNGLLALNELGVLWLALGLETYNKIHHSETFIKDVKVLGNDIYILSFDGERCKYKGSEYTLRTSSVGIMGDLIIIDNKDLGFWSVDRRVYINTKADDEEVFFGS